MVSRIFPERIKTARLTMRQYVMEDSICLFELVEKNRSQLISNFGPTAKQLTSIESTRNFIADCEQQWDQGTTFHFGLYVDAGQLIGQIKVKNIDLQNESLELSYFIGQEYQRNGYAREGIWGIMRYAITDLQFRSIIVRIIAANKASLQLAQHLGFKLVEIREKEFTCGFGEVHDVHVFMLNSL